MFALENDITQEHYVVR